MQRVLAGIDPYGADGYRVRPLWHGDVLLVLQSPYREPLGAGARPVYPIRIISCPGGNSVGFGVKQTFVGDRDQR